MESKSKSSKDLVTINKNLKIEIFYYLKVKYYLEIIKTSKRFNIIDKYNNNFFKIISIFKRWKLGSDNYYNLNIDFIYKRLKDYLMKQILHNL